MSVEPRESAPRWARFLTEEDRATMSQMGDMGSFGLGSRPALLVIDNTYEQLGWGRLPLRESIQRWPGSFGTVGWDAVDRTALVLASARAAGVPVVFSKRWPAFPVRSKLRSAVRAIPPEPARPGEDEIVEELAPRAGELVIEKAAPSVFFGTALPAYLAQCQVDTVILCGNSTSGCIRAAACDGASYRYRVGVVADCCMDRIDASHAISLFDINFKYGDVIEHQAAIAYFEAVGRGEMAPR